MFLSRTVDSPLPRKMKRLLLFSLPSLVLLGLIGMTGWRWWRKRERRIRHSSAASQQGHTTLYTGQRSPAGSEDSGVVDTGPNSQTGDSRKNSEEDLTAIHPPPSKPPRLHSKTKTESEKPIPSWRFPKASSDVQSELLSDVDSLSSGEGLLSKSQHFEISAIAGNKSKGVTVSRSASLLGSDSFHLPTEGVQKSFSTPTMGGDNWRDRKRVMVQLPRDLVGRFIGKQGRNIKSLMVEANGAHVYVNQKNLSKDALIVPCTVQGTADQVEQALQIIATRYPELDLPNQLDKDWSTQPPLPSPLFGTPRLNGETWDTVLPPTSIPSSPFSAMVSYIESLSRLWIVPYERSRELDEQHQGMSYTYCYAAATGNDTVHASEGDDGLLKKFCAVRVSDIHWLRGQIAKFSDDGVNYEVLLVDYGSTVIVPHSAIRPLRREHSSLPIQAFPCELANVVPNDAMSEEGLVCLQSLVEGVVLEVHITGNTTTSPPKPMDQTSPVKTESPGSDSPSDELEDSAVQQCFRVPPAPLVELYMQFGTQTPLFINRELVERGYAIWREVPLTNES